MLLRADPGLSNLCTSDSLSLSFTWSLMPLSGSTNKQMTLSNFAQHMFTYVSSLVRVSSSLQLITSFMISAGLSCVASIADGSPAASMVSSAFSSSKV